MKYLLVSKHTDEIVDKVDLESEVGITGAKTYFVGIKRLEEQEFTKLWNVMTEDQWNTTFKNNLQNRQMGKRKYEWWKDDEEWLDIDH